MPATKEEFLKRMEDGRAKKKQQEGTEDTPKKTTTPWKPAKMLFVPEELKDPRFVYRFVNTKREGNELKKQQEGWEYDLELSKKLVRHFGETRKLEDGTPIDSVYRIRELVVMRMPKEMAQARNEYYAKRGDTSLQTMTKQFKDGMDEDTQVRVYGNSKEEKVTI
jgi:hypothetical protein